MIGTYDSVEKFLARRLLDLAKDNGAIPAEKMAAFTSDSTLHSEVSVAHAFESLTGKQFDARYFSD